MRLAVSLLFILFGMFAGNLSGQLNVVQAKRFPKHPAKDTWYSNPDSVGTFWYFDGQQWRRIVAGDDRLPFLHLGLVWIPKGEHHTLATTSGKVIIEDANMVANNGRVFVGLSGFRDLFAITVAGDTLAYFEVIRHSTRHGYSGDPLWSHARHRGKTFEILPQYVPGLMGTHPVRVRNWGMVDSTGTWVIPPVYDEPFRLINGVADVTKYGKRIRINEKGEVIE